MLQLAFSIAMTVLDRLESISKFLTTLKARMKQVETTAQ